MRGEIRDSRNFILGYWVDNPNDIQYFGYTKGYIGRWDKVAKRFFWMSGPNLGKMGPGCDIGASEVLKAEGGR